MGEIYPNRNIGSCGEKIDFDNQPLLDTVSMIPRNTYAQGITIIANTCFTPATLTRYTFGRKRKYLSTFEGHALRID